MRASRFLVVVLLALAASACMRTAAPPTAAVQATAKTDIDSLMVARAAAKAPMARVPAAPAPASAAPTAAMASATMPVVAPVPVAVAPDPAYVLDTGDKLRIVVFGQEGLSNFYGVDAAGNVTLPLIGTVAARGRTTQALARAIGERLREGYIREPHVAIEVEIYRPFFILGEVVAPGQYPYVPQMTIETAVAIAGGFTPRAYRYDVKLDRPAPGGEVRSRGSVPLLTKVLPGDTIVITERWF